MYNYKVTERVSLKTVFEQKRAERTVCCVKPPARHTVLLRRLCPQPPHPVRFLFPSVFEDALK